MTYYGLSGYWYHGSGLLPTTFNRLATVPGWTITYNGSVDGAGHVVYVAQNDDNGYVLVGWRDNLVSYSVGYAYVTVAESYDFASGTVTNPAVVGSWAPLAGDVAYSAPVELRALSTSGYAGYYYYNTSRRNYQTGFVANRDAIAFDVTWYRTTTAYYRRTWMVAPFQSLCPTLEPTFAPKVFYYSNGIGLGFNGGAVNRSPLSSTSPLPTNWTTTLTPWHTLGYYGTDRFAVDPTALPSTRAAVYRTSGSDGYGTARGLLNAFRWGAGAAEGQQITDEDGDIWEWRYGSTATTTSGTSTNPGFPGAGPFSGWWRV